MPATMADNTDNEQMLLEGVVYYVDPKSVGTLAFLGGKERIHIPITSTHSSLEALRRHFIEYAGLKAESETRGGVLGSIFAGYVPLASPNPYPIIVYSVANF